MKMTEDYLDRYSIREGIVNLFLEKKDHLIKKHKNWNTLSQTQQEELLNYFSQRDQVPELIIDWNKLNSYDIFDIYRHSKLLTKTARKKSVKINGVGGGLEEDKDYVRFPLEGYNTFIPLSWEASKLLASKYIGACEGKWCTAYQKSRKYWDKYRREGAVLIYIFTSNTKYAVAVYPKDSKLYRLPGSKNVKLEIFDARDSSMSSEELNTVLNLNIEEEIQKHEDIIEYARDLIEKLEKAKYNSYLAGAIPFYDEDLEILKEMIKENLDLSRINVSNVTNMSYLFHEAQYTGDISKWDVSNVKNMSAMFAKSQFNGDISNWNVSNVENMSSMFNKSNFNNNISNWDISNVKDLSSMFFTSRFNSDISNWDVSNVKTMSSMFFESQFSNDISTWDVSNVENMNFMFAYSQFTGDISNWDVSRVTDMFGMFKGAQFNGDISKWNVSNVKNMTSMFAVSQFNRDISNWDISHVTKSKDIFKKSPLERVYPNGLDDIRKVQQNMYSNPLKEYLYKTI
jgi:surface protein